VNVLDPLSIVLPPWAEVGDKRRAHIARVTALLMHWAHALGIGDEERAAWYDAGRWHDALRDADEATLRAITNDRYSPWEVLHGPAAAIRLADDGERRGAVLEAVRWHTLGSGQWDRTGRALFMADFLEPGRKFMRAERAWLARQACDDFDGVFRQVVKIRLEWALREGKALHAETVALWNGVC
jgi:2-amino-4-hydroxy-6-hydroxymethyldihydropteridine diphosphokinase